jgi:hypothetical protein
MLHPFIAANTYVEAKTTIFFNFAKEITAIKAFFFIYSQHNSLLNRLLTLINFFYLVNPNLGGYKKRA